MLFNEEFFEGHTETVVSSDEYRPNPTDKRVVKRLKKVLKELTGLVDKHGICNHSSRKIDKVLGNSSNSLSKWLREVLFVTTREFYDPDNKICKERQLNKTGRDYIKGLLDGSVTKTWSEYKEHVAHQEKVKTNIKLSKVSARNLEFIPIEDALLFCEEKYGDALRGGSIEYTEKSNRLWHTLQSIPSVVRNKFLAINGYVHDYDIKCCNITLLTQHARRCNDRDRLQNKGTGKKVPVFNDGPLLRYMKAKTDIRQQIADDLGVEVDTVKEVITAILNGAGITRKFSVLKKKLGADLAYAFDRHEEIKRIKAGIKSCWECITSYDDRRKTTLRKYKGRYIESKKPLSPRQKAEVYFKLEKQVIDSINKFLVDAGNVPYLIHDGWITRKPIDIYELKKFVKKRTGFDIDIAHEILEE